MKIKHSKLSELSGLTSKEMDFFFYLIRFQDDYGNVIGVHNREVCRLMGMCKQSFYNVLRSLEAKKIITVEKNSDCDYDVHITGNDCSTEELRKEGYIQMDLPVFRSKEFLSLKGHEKYMFLELYWRNLNSKKKSKSFEVGVNNFYTKLAFVKALGVSKRVIRGYLHSLKHFFSIGIKEGKYYITYRKSLFKSERGSLSNNEKRNGHLVRTGLRRNKSTGNQREIYDTAKLLDQYKKVAARLGMTITDLKEMLLDCIGVSMRGKALKDRKLSARHVHKILHRRLCEI